MAPIDRRQAEELFLDLIEIPTDRRLAELERRTSGNQPLRDEVLRLVRIDTAAGDFLNKPALTAPTDAPAALPTRIGNYDIVRTLGEGGMGMVYEARQASPNRTVALKLIRPGFTTSELARRLQREAAALGLLQHPGIACIYEAGVATLAASSAAQPFIAMELVRGVAITDHAKAADLSPRQIAELVARVADAVQHAHERGVVHRDLKPRNIFVDELGQPKVLDFGIAKVVGDAPAGATLHTGTGALLGTLDYMSPEQVSGDSARIDARSDVYALGAVLFELLAGYPPHRLASRPIAEAIRVIREDDAPHLPRDSTTHHDNSHARFDDDLATIVDKALEKEAERRYATAAALAADLRHYLRDEPIVARPTTALYQLRKFARRNRVLVGGIAATMAALTAGLIGTLLLAARESSARALAERRLAESTLLSYRASMAAAHAGIEAGDVTAALHHLDATPQDLRGWEWHLSRRMADPSEGGLPTRADGVVAQAMNLDRRIAAGTVGNSVEGAVIFWDPFTGNDLPFGPHEGAGRVVEITADASAMLCSRDSGDLALIDIATGNTKWKVSFPGGPVAWSFDATESRLATVSRAAGGDILDAATGQSIARVDVPDQLASISMSPDGRRVGFVTQADSGVYDLDEGRVLWRRAGFFQWFSSDGTRGMMIVREASGLTRGQIVEVANGQLIRSIQLAAFAPWTGGGNRWTTRGDRLVVGTTRNAIASLDANTLEELQRMPAGWPMRGIWVSRSGDTVLAQHRDGRTRFWSLPPRSARLDHPTWSTATEVPVFSPDGRLMARAEWGSIAMMEVPTGKVLWRRGLSVRSVHRPAFDPAGQRVVAHDGEGVVVILDARRGEILARRITLQAKPIPTAVAWTRQGIAVATSDGTIAMYDPDSIEKDPQSTSRSDGIARRIVVAGPTFAAAREATATDGRSRWTIEYAGKGIDLPNPAIAVTSLATGSTQGDLLIGRADGTAVVISGRSTASRTLISGASSQIVAIVAHPLERRVAGLSADGALILWGPAESGSAPLIAVRLGLAGDSGDLWFDPQGRALAIANAARSALISPDGFDLEQARAAERYRVAALRVEEMRPRGVSANEIAARLHAMTGEPPEAIEDALAFNNALGDAAALLNSHAWGFCRTPGASTAQVESAFAASRAAAAALPDHPSILNTLGTTFLRLGRYDEAITALRRADERFNQLGRSSRAANVAALAMALEHSGQHHQARVALHHAIELSTKAPLDSDTALIMAEAKALFHEAKPDTSHDAAGTLPDFAPNASDPPRH